MVSQFILKEILNGEEKTLTVYTSWADAISQVFDATNRTDMIIEEVDDESGDKHIFNFDHDVR